MTHFEEEEEEEEEESESEAAAAAEKEKEGERHEAGGLAILWLYSLESEDS